MANLGWVAGEFDCLCVCGVRLGGAAGPAEQFGAGRVERVVVLQGQSLDCGQCHVGPVQFGGDDGSVERDDRGRIDVVQLVVKRGESRPVGISELARCGVDGVDRRLGLVRPGLVVPGTGTYQCVALADERLVPAGAVLLVQGHQLAGLVDTGGTTRVSKQQKRE